VERYVRDVEAGGSNPLTPTILQLPLNASVGIFQTHNVVFAQVGS